MNKNNSSRDGSFSVWYGVRLRLDPQGMIESRDENHRSAAKCLQVARRIVSKRYLRYSSLIFARFQAVFDSFAASSYQVIQQLLRSGINKTRRDDHSFHSRTRIFGKSMRRIEKLKQKSDTKLPDVSVLLLENLLERAL